MPLGLVCVDAAVFPSTPESSQCLMSQAKYEQACSENVWSLSLKMHKPVGSLASKPGKPPEEAYDFLELFERNMVRNEDVEASDNLGTVDCIVKI